MDINFLLSHVAFIAIASIEMIHAVTKIKLTIG